MPATLELFPLIGAVKASDHHPLIEIGDPRPPPAGLCQEPVQEWAKHLLAKLSPNERFQWDEVAENILNEATDQHEAVTDDERKEQCNAQPYPVSAAMVPPRPPDFFRSRNSIHHLRIPNSHGITSFADLHLLNPFIPYRYKNHRGEEAAQSNRILKTNRENAETPDAHPFFFSITYKLQISQPLSFDIHANWWGGVPPSRPFPNIPTCQPATHFLPIPFRFIFFQTLCAHQKLNSFLFKQIRTLFRKHPGVGVPSVSRSRGNREGAEQRGMQISAWKHVTSLFLLCETANAVSRTIQEPSS
jgi:hypothetical protein